MSYDAFGVGTVLPRYAFAGRAAVCGFRCLCGGKLGRCYAFAKCAAVCGFWCLCGGKLSRCYAFAGHVVVYTYGVIADGGIF